MRSKYVIVCGFVISAGCATDLDTGVVIATPGGDDATASRGPTGSTSTRSDTDGSTSATQATATSTSGDATSASSTATDSTGTDTEGFDGSACDSNQKVCALVELDDMPAGLCGQTLELKGIAQPIMPDVWQLEDCGACELCGGPTYTVEFIGPDMWTPDALPLCSRIAIDYAPMDNTPWACAFVGMSIWGDDGLGEDPAPLYVAASIVTDSPSTVQGLQVQPNNINPKPCDGSSCCYVEPGDYALTFTGAGLSEPLTLEAKQEALGVTAFGRSYDLRVERCRGLEQCDKIPEFDWIMRR